MNTLERTTVFSPDRVYRYTLWREWSDLLDQNSSFVQFIALNPSTADETINDPTIRRCIQFAKDWGYGALCMTNLFAFRATDPKDMKAVQDPMGPDNMDWLIRVALNAPLIICAWGSHGTYRKAGYDLLQHLRYNTSCGHKMRHLGLCQNLEPKHPLYLASETKPTPFSP